MAGVLSGARLGSKVIPIPLVGPIVGGAIGGVLGTELGKRLGKAAVNGGDAFLKTLRGAES